jgi:hypothetical protein
VPFSAKAKLKKGKATDITSKLPALSHSTADNCVKVTTSEPPTPVQWKNPALFSACPYNS